MSRSGQFRFLPSLYGTRRPPLSRPYKVLFGFGGRSEKVPPAGPAGSPAGWFLVLRLDRRRLREVEPQAGRPEVLTLRSVVSRASAISSSPMTGAVGRAGVVLGDSSVQDGDRGGPEGAPDSGKKTITLEIGSRKVFMSNQNMNPSATGPVWTLIVVWGFGRKPLALLASEHLGGEGGGP